jgi:gluconolactonase
MVRLKSGSEMLHFKRAQLFIICLLSFGQCVQAEPGDEKVIVSGVGGPEGPVFVGSDLYYVGWTDDVMARWNGHAAKTLQHEAGCEHNGLAAIQGNHLLIACLKDPGTIIEVTSAGKEVRRWTTDIGGRPLKGGVNDFAVAPNGGIYATLSGPLNDPPGLIAGKVLYLAPSSSQWVEVADALNYANGLAVSPDGRTLYVAESIGNSVIKFAIQADGTLADRANFAMLHVLIPDKIRSAFIGPDGIRLDRVGNLYVAQYNGGKILKISPSGKLLHVFKVSTGDGVTNVALSADETELYVTVVRDPNDPKALGSIVRIANVRAP